VSGVAIPKTIVSIGDGAFSGSGITELYFDAVSCADLNARNWVFYPDGEHQNISIIIGKDVEHLPARLFFPLITDPLKIPALNGLFFEEGSALKSIGDYAFYHCSNINGVVLPDSLQSIGDYAFADTDLTQIYLPDSLRSIGTRAFYGAEALQDVRFPHSLEAVEEQAFAYCSALRNVNLFGSAPIPFGKETFLGCEALTKINLPQGQTILPESFAFNCSSLTETYLGNELQVIGGSAFQNCSSLSRVFLPKTLTTIGNKAFQGCSKLVTLIYDAAACADLPSGNEVFSGCSSSLDVVIAQDVVSVPSHLFFSTSDESSNPNITSIRFVAKALVSVGDYAFYPCQNAVAVYHFSKTLWESVSIGTHNDCLSSIVYEGASL